MIRRAALLVLGVLAVAGCASRSSGYSAVDDHQVVLIPDTRSGAIETALARGARREAARLHESLAVARPTRPDAAAQILVADAVTGEKPGGVIIVPAAANALTAPILSMRKAGIDVVVITPGEEDAAAAGRGALARVVAAIRGRART